MTLPPGRYTPEQIAVDRYGVPYDPGSVMAFATPQQGWQCPVCKHVMAPALTVCPHCPVKPGIELSFIGSLSPEQVEEFRVRLDRDLKRAMGDTDRLTCCKCGDPHVVYRNYEDKPFCGPCAEGERQEPLTIRLPDEMAREGSVKFRTISHEWSEVFPGLQAKVVEVKTPLVEGVTASIEADVRFRLTPKTCPGGC